MKNNIKWFPKSDVHMWKCYYMLRHKKIEKWSMVSQKVMEMLEVDETLDPRMLQLQQYLFTTKN